MTKVTLVASPPEVQYVALRNINLLLQDQPDILSKELRVFFCKYNDPAYIKFEKLEIMVRIANNANVDQLLAELKEYALEVDMDIVKRAVKAIGQVAIKIESATERCVNTLLELINTKVNYVVQEAIIVIKDIFRKYPGYEGIIPELCKCIEELDEPVARGALIWIVGEYAEKISNAGDILTGFVDGFAEEFTQILTGCVKYFLKRPQSPQAQALVQRIFQAATAETDNPDVRDRAYVYWRLLSSNPQVAQNVVLSDKPPITSTIPVLPSALLQRLLGELSTLASVYHKPAESFVGEGRYGADAMQKAAIEEQMQNARENPIAVEAAVVGAPANAENLLDIDFDGALPASKESDSTAIDSMGLDANSTLGLDSTTAVVIGNGDHGTNSLGLDSVSPSLASAANLGSTALDSTRDLTGADWTSTAPGMSNTDILGGFASTSEPKKSNADLLDLF